MRKKRVLALMMAAMLAAGGIGETAMAAAPFKFYLKFVHY